MASDPEVNRTSDEHATQPTLRLASSRHLPRLALVRGEFASGAERKTARTPEGQSECVATLIFSRAVPGGSVLCRLPRQRNEEGETRPGQHPDGRRDETSRSLGKGCPQASRASDASHGKAAAGRKRL